MSDSTIMPAAFIGHGSPMNAIETNRYTEAWQRVSATWPRPRAVLVISAHWFTNATAVTAMASPRTIHDFYGFPDELFAIEYPAAGDPEVADLVVETVKPRWVGYDHDIWGFDHGNWVVLSRMFPDADVPVLQLSINAEQPLEYHLDIGARLAPLRREGILIIASGNVVHNLRRVDYRSADDAFDWNRRFDLAATEIMLGEPGDILRLVDHPDYHVAVPTPDHFIPLLHVAALAAEDDQTPELLVEGSVGGSISMTSFTLNAYEASGTDAGHQAAEQRQPQG